MLHDRWPSRCCREAAGLVKYKLAGRIVACRIQSRRSHHSPRRLRAEASRKRQWIVNFGLGGELAEHVPVLVVTRGPHGAVGIARGQRAEVAAVPVAHVVDTTGAGDLFAAGFLSGHVQGLPLAECLRRGAVCAAEIISHYGARPEADLAELVG